jgi:hypothetical protein
MLAVLAASARGSSGECSTTGERQPSIVRACNRGAPLGAGPTIAHRWSSDHFQSALLSASGFNERDPETNKNGTIGRRFFGMMLISVEV